jgi:AraC-like DNA-binding protein
MPETGAEAAAEPRHLRRRASRLQMRDPDMAAELLTSVYLPVRLLPSPARPSFVMKLAELQMGRMTAGVLSFATATRIISGEVEQVHLNLTLRGNAVWRGQSPDPTHTGPREGVVYHPEQVADTLWSDGSDHLCLMFPLESLEVELEALTGRSMRSPLRFSSSFTLEGALSRLLAPTCQLLVAELHDPDSALRFPAIGRHLEALVLDGLLLGHRHSHSELLEQSSRIAGTPISRAVELLEERPEHPWTTVGLAQEVHLSVRALQEGFRRQLDVAPMAYLRRVRMRRVHHALAAAPPRSVRVQDVALRYGFLHLGRFSAAYREEYGENPSTTLARLPAHDS